MYSIRLVNFSKHKIIIFVGSSMPIFYLNLQREKYNNTMEIGLFFIFGLLQDLGILMDL